MLGDEKEQLSDQFFFAIIVGHIVGWRWWVRINTIKGIWSKIFT